MNAVSLYVSTCRLVLQASTDDAGTWSELGRLLPQLRKALSCSVCSQIVTDPMRPAERLCPHCVCRECLGAGNKAGNSVCNWCKEIHEQFTEDKQFRTLLLCFRKLCEFVVVGAPYAKLNPTEGSGLADLLLECVGLKDELVPTTTSTTTYGENGNSIFIDEPGRTSQSANGDSKSAARGASLYSVGVGGDNHRSKIAVVKRKQDRGGGSSSSSDLSDAADKSFKKIKASESVKAKLSRNRLSLRKGCRCGNATPTPGKLTCCGQRCPCYVSAKGCSECRCRGCRNPHKLNQNQEQQNNMSLVEVANTVTVVTDDKTPDPGSDVDILL